MQCIAHQRWRWRDASAEVDAGVVHQVDRQRGADADQQCRVRGPRVRLECEGGWQEGDALGLAADGALRVRIDGVEQRVHAGEVSVRPER